jgi:hypothetical protein
VSDITDWLTKERIGRVANRPFTEVHMLKIVLMVIATAALAVAAGIWAESTMARHHPVEANGTPATISPYEMHLKVKPNDLPVQYMQSDAF